MMVPLMGELLLGLRYLRNSSSSMKRSSLVNYCLIYGTSETTPASRVRTSSVSYYLDYGTSETEVLMQHQTVVVNYCLVYRTSETIP